MKLKRVVPKMKMKKELLIMTLVMMSLVSCGDGSAYVIQPGDDLHLAENMELDYENAIFDDFSNGVTSEYWYIGKQAWGGNNGGVIPQNVHYTDDGVLVLTGNGGYYKDGDVRGVGDIKDGRYTGAALISKFLVSAGRYEIKMKVLPRQGACTAFWIYSNDIETGANHEIDIELPGGNRSGVISFENVLNTNYITEQYNQSQDVKVSTLFDHEEVFLNDGEWHVYGFDWYTNPKEVVYYLDGKVTAVSNIFVPDMQSRLWLGCWFPVTSSFVGTANFETDNMYVDYVKYIPFKNQPSTPFLPPISGYAFESEYPSEPIATPHINKVAHGTFEGLNASATAIGGWSISAKLSEDREPNEVVKIVENQGYDSSSALEVIDGGIASQYIDSVYHNFQYDLSFYGQGKGNVTIRFYGKTTAETISSEVITIDSDQLQQYKASLTAPEGCQMIQIRIDTSTGNRVVVDQVSMLQK